MDEVFIGVFIVLAVAIGAFVGVRIEHGDSISFRENYKISCLELNLGKETCDKIFNKTKE